MMECNKEEAIRAMGIARHKLENDDFEGAKKLALKARSLFPELESITQLLTVCDVHHCSKHKLYGSEMDWYGILQVERSADESSIKKQYRKLAMLLHPDKNKFTGADAAFKLIREANIVLTDQTKRHHYDMKTSPNSKPTPNPSDTHASSDQTKHSLYDYTKAAPKQLPHRLNTSANANQTKHSQYYYTKAAPKQLPHRSNTGASADQMKHSQYDTKAAPKEIPHGLNTADTDPSSWPWYDINSAFKYIFGEEPAPNTTLPNQSNTADANSAHWPPYDRYSTFTSTFDPFTYIFGGESAPNTTPPKPSKNKLANANTDQTNGSHHDTETKPNTNPPHDCSDCSDDNYFRVREEVSSSAHVGTNASKHDRNCNDDNDTDTGIKSVCCRMECCCFSFSLCSWS